MNFTYADASRNLLHLIFAGTLDATAAAELLKDVTKASLHLRPGFDVLSDFRDLKSIDRKAIRMVDDLMEFLTRQGVGRVVRILPSEKENFGLAIMSIFHYGKDVRFVTCLNLEEAGKILTPAE